MIFCFHKWMGRTKCQMIKDLCDINQGLAQEVTKLKSIEGYADDGLGWKAQGVAVLIVHESSLIRDCDKVRLHCYLEDSLHQLLFCLLQVYVILPSYRQHILHLPLMALLY